MTDSSDLNDGWKPNAVQMFGDAFAAALDDGMLPGVWMFIGTSFPTEGDDVGGTMVMTIGSNDLFNWQTLGLLEYTKQIVLNAYQNPE